MGMRDRGAGVLGVAVVIVYGVEMRIEISMGKFLKYAHPGSWSSPRVDVTVHS